MWMAESTDELAQSDPGLGIPHTCVLVWFAGGPRRLAVVSAGQLASLFVLCPFGIPLPVSAVCNDHCNCHSYRGGRGLVKHCVGFV